MKANCTNLSLAAAATCLLSVGGMALADQAGITPPGRAMPTFAATPIGGQPLVWDNGGPDGSNGLSHFEGNLTGTPFNRELADDMVTGTADGSGWQVTGVQMSGVWFSGVGAPGPLQALRVRFWEDDGGQPGAVVYDATVSFTATNTGGVFFTRPEVSYTAAVDVILDENTTYWVGIQPVGTTDNFFHLTSAEEAPEPDSCAGNCGGNAGNCWCDEECCNAGDCCPDKFAECGGCQPISGGALGGLLGEEAHLRGDFDPGFPDWTPASVVFGTAYDITFKVFGFPADAVDCPGDLNSDGVVDVSDLLILLGAWGPNPGHPADLNEDGVVDVSDLLILLGAWGACPAPPDPTGACCLPDFGCEDGLTQTECDDAGGNYAGNFSTCSMCPQPPSGDTCTDPLPIDIDGGPVDGNTQGNPVAEPGVCAGLTPSSGTIWYQVVGDGRELTADTCGSDIEARIAVFCATCDNNVCVDSSSEHETDCPGNPFTASLTWCAADGEVYHIAVWGTTAEGNVSLEITSGDTCTSTVDCEPPALDDCTDHCGGTAPAGCWCDELCCDLGDCCDNKTDACGGCQWPPAPCDPVSCVDNVGEACGDDQNSGCSADPPTMLFDNINFGDTKCGNIWADGGTRDLDWFLIEVTEPTEVAWAVDADEVTNAWIIGGAVTTCGTLDTIAFDSGCSIVLEACLAPGTYAVVVGASVFDGHPCPGYQYEATLTGTPVSECAGPSPDSCVGNCGANAGNCWCDETCCTAGDCCPDKFAECGGCQP